MPLFKSTSELEKFVPIDANTPFELIRPFIVTAESKFISGLLGDLYPILLFDYTENTDVEGIPNDQMADENKALLPYVQSALAEYAAYLSVGKIGVSLGASGIQEQFGNSSRPAPRWKIRELQLQYLAEGDSKADGLLEFLESHASSTQYNAWYSDIDANTAMQGIIVHKTSIASRYVDINESRRVFLRMRKRIQDIEQDDIRRMLCADQYEEIVAQIKTGSVSTNNYKLLGKLEPYITKKALWLTIPSIKVSVTDEGLTIHSSNDGVVQKSAAAKEDITAFMTSLKEGEYGFEADKNKLDQFIIENIGSFPLISSSPCWTSQKTTLPKYKADNSPCNKHFSV
jgi:hypothetical protein